MREKEILLDGLVLEAACFSMAYWSELLEAQHSQTGMGSMLFLCAHKRKDCRYLLKNPLDLESFTD